MQNARTLDYSLHMQDYIGFSFASEQSRNSIMKMIFGREGLSPGIIKLFLDPLP